jgi:Fur family transcriptional regulator, ferric uptake regulator
MRASSVELIILDVLSHEDHHLTSHELYETIRSKLPAVNPSTVYRALERLVNLGKISVSDMGTGAAVYESVAHGPHHHFVCQSCGKIITIKDDRVHQFFTSLQEQYHFEIATNHLVLFGKCEECLLKEKTGGE